MNGKGLSLTARQNAWSPLRRIEGDVVSFQSDWRRTRATSGSDEETDADGTARMSLRVRVVRLERVRRVKQMCEVKAEEVCGGGRFKAQEERQALYTCGEAAAASASEDSVRSCLHANVQTHSSHAGVYALERASESRQCNGTAKK